MRLRAEDQESSARYRRLWAEGRNAPGAWLSALGLVTLGLVLTPAGSSGDDAPAAARLTTDGLDKERPGWAPDGRHLLYSRQEPGGSAIWLQVLDTRSPGAPRRLTDRKMPEYHGVFSPDGKTVLFTAITLSGTQGNLDVVSVSADGSGLKKLTDDHGKLVHQDWPAWSPDGLRIAFTSSHEGNQEVYAAAADGSNLVRLTQHAGLDAHPCWSSDGRSIAFATDRWGGLELATVRPDGSATTRLTHSPGLDDYPAFAPDGRLAFVSNRDGQFEVYVARPDGSGPSNLSRHPGRDTFPTWTPDGKGVTFVSDRGGGSDLYTMPAPTASGVSAP